MWLRPNYKRREADAAKALLTVPDGDHLTLLNVYNNYIQSDSFNSLLRRRLTLIDNFTDMYDKNWTWANYLSARALAQADNVRAQLRRTMERCEVELVSMQDEKKLWQSVRQALVCGFFMQVAHKEGEKGNYTTVKDNQVHSRLQFGCYSLLTIFYLCRLLLCTLPAVSTHRLIGLFSTSLW